MVLKSLKDKVKEELGEKVCEGMSLELLSAAIDKKEGDAQQQREQQPSLSPTELCNPSHCLDAHHSSPLAKKRRTSIVFHEAHIFEFEPTVWTTSVPSSGVPVGLSSKLRRRLRRRINSFEEEREQNGRVDRQEFMDVGWLQVEDREKILSKGGILDQARSAAEIEVNKINAGRQESNEEDYGFGYEVDSDLDEAEEVEDEEEEEEQEEVEEQEEQQREEAEETDTTTWDSSFTILRTAQDLIKETRASDKESDEDDGDYLDDFLS